MTPLVSDRNRLITTQMKLSEIVRPDARIARSVNLERDLTDPETLDRYLLTGKAAVGKGDVDLSGIRR